MSKEELLEKLEKLDFWAADIIAQCSELMEECEGLQNSLIDLMMECEEK